MTNQPSDHNQIEFPDSLFGDNTPAAAPPPPKANRDMQIIVTLIVALLCLLLLGGVAGVYLYGQYTSQVSAQGTATGAAIATQVKSTAQAELTRRASATRTAIFKKTELANYAITDSFDDNKNDWRIGAEDNELWKGETSITDGVYRWDVQETTSGFVAWGGPSAQETISDFDLYVDARLTTGDPNSVCYGILMREDPETFDNGAYIFSICDTGYFIVRYFEEPGGWQDITDWTETPLIVAGQWNRLEVSARGDNFVFSINGEKVYEMNDSRQAEGYISLMVDVYEKVQAVVEFDNFGLQPR
jgi:hypothetical protein